MKRIYEDGITRRCFFYFILPYCEYCSPVWSSAAELHVRPLDRYFNSMNFLLPDLGLDTGHRWGIGPLSVMNKIVSYNSHSPYKFIPDFINLQELLVLNYMTVDVRTSSQFSRYFY